MSEVAVLHVHPTSKQDEGGSSSALNSSPRRVIHRRNASCQFLLQAVSKFSVGKMVGRSRMKQQLTYPLVIEDKSCSSGSRKVRSRAEHFAVKQRKRVECANTLSLHDFEKTFCPEDWKSRLVHSSDEYSAAFEPLLTDPKVNDPSGDADLIEECFQLIELTSAEDYAKSEMGWSPVNKRKEMKLPDMKYLILRASHGSRVEGFISFMATYEDSREVLYVYEIHLMPDLQGKGMGRKLMEAAEQVGRNIGLEKSMLTVFRSNTKAIAMYERLGYSVDEFSPQPKVLRNGSSKESTYVILSKGLRSSAREGVKATS